MNLKQLPYFIAIAETGSLSAAARRTGVSQPTISDYLHELEHELGTPLFERRQRRMLPTEAGAAYLQMARQVLILQTRAQDMIQNRHLQKKQSIRIGVSPHRGVQCLAALYQTFIKHFPQQEIEPIEGYMSGILEMLHAGKLDLGFATTANSAFDDSLCFAHSAGGNCAGIACLPPTCFLCFPGSGTGCIGKSVRIPGYPLCPDELRQHHRPGQPTAVQPVRI